MAKALRVQMGTDITFVPILHPEKLEKTPRVMVLSYTEHWTRKGQIQKLTGVDGELTRKKDGVNTVLTKITGKKSLAELQQDIIHFLTTNN